MRFQPLNNNVAGQLSVEVVELVGEVAARQTRFRLGPNTETNWPTDHQSLHNLDINLNLRKSLAVVDRVPELVVIRAPDSVSKIGIGQRSS